MAQLGVEVRTHMPRGSDGRRVTARSKGKVERPFRTVKEAHETLYHFHAPQDEAEANLWLRHYLARYNARPTGRASIPGPRTGRLVSRKRASGPCAPGNGSAPSRASPSAAGSVLTPGCRWTALLTRSSLPWRARR